MIAGPLLVFRYGAGTGGGPRWGFAVGKKLAKKSVTRNAVRRRMRAAAWRLEGIPARDIVVVARGRALSATVAEFEREMSQVARRAGWIGRREA